MEELKRVQGSRVDEFSRRRLIENLDTIDELTARIQELQNEVNCENDSRDIKDAESVRSGPSHVPSQPALCPSHRDPGRNAEPQQSAARYLELARYVGDVFANPTASSSSPYPQESNPWISKVSEHTSPHVLSECQTPVQDQRCQSGPSARNSVILSEGISFPDCQDTQDKQLTQYLLIYSGKEGRCSKISEHSQKSECPDIWIRLPRHEWPKSWSRMEDPSCSS